MTTTIDDNKPPTRTPVTLEEVRAAYEALWPVHQRRPGLHAMREHIGHGSFPKISQLLDQVEAERYAKQPVAPGTVFPDRVKAGLESLMAEVDAAYAEREQALEAKAVQMQAEADAKVEAADAARAAAEAQAEQLDVELQGTSRRIAELEKQVQELDKALESTRQALQGKEELVEALRNAKQEAVTRLVQAEQAAAKRERDLGAKLEELHLERLQQEQRHQKERDEGAKALADLRDIVGFQHSEAERQRSESMKALSEKDALLATTREELDTRTRMLAKTEEEATDLRHSLRDLERVVTQQQQAIDAALARQEADGEHIRDLERQLAEAAGKEKQ